MKQSIQLLVAFCLLLISSQSFAQVRIIPKVGVNASALDAKLLDIQTEARAGWNAGFDFRMGEGGFFFQPGVHLYNFSADLRTEVNDVDDFALSEETTIQQVKLPINIGISLTGGEGLLNIYGKGGIVPTYALSVKERPGFDLAKEDLNPFTLGANFGVGMDLLFLNIEATYEIGLDDFFENAEGRNNMLTLSAGIKF